MIIVLCCVCLLILPCCVFALGLHRRAGCSAMRARLGYSSELALQGPHAWALAQRLCSRRYMAASVAMAAFSLWCLYILPARTPAAQIVVALTLLLFQIDALVLVIATIEVSLRKRTQAASPRT